MKIGLYVSSASVRLGYEFNVSGHIQIPLHAIKLLRDAGHDARLITNRYDASHTLPACLPAGAPVHLVDDARIRGSADHHKGPLRRGVRIGLIKRQLQQIRRIVDAERLEALHLFGFNRTAYLGGMLRVIGVRAPIILTIYRADFPERFGVFTRPLWKRLDAVITATEFVQRQCGSVGLDAAIVRHGIVRNLQDELGNEAIGAKKRVLFWRDPSLNNGADICAKVYDALAPRHPELWFDLAVRPHWAEVEGLDDLAGRHENVHIYRFPYEHGISLPKLVMESLCVLAPFRRMTINPQLAIAESLAAGVPVVASRLWSSPELITPGRNGELAPVGDVGQTIDAVERVIADRDRALEMGRNAAVDLENSWNWDRYVEETVAVYESCLVKRGVPA